jgi:hypothetical protein
MSSHGSASLGVDGHELSSVVGLYTGPIELIYRKDSNGVPISGMRVDVNLCTREGCACREVELVVESEHRVAHALVGTGRKYRLTVNVDDMQWKPTEAHSGPEEDVRLLEALRRELKLGSDLHEDLSARLAHARGDWGEPLEGFDYAEAAQGIMVRFSELFPKSQAAMLSHEGADYLIDDDWCARPSCQCRAGLIHLYRVANAQAEPASTKATADAAYAGSIHYPRHVKDPLPPDLKPLPRAIAEVLNTADMTGFLQGRREAVRKAADAHLRAAPTPAGPVKVGRNASCPCGSGKKFKKCCQNSAAHA